MVPIETRDGYALSLYRLRGSGAPVLLIPGLSANRFSFGVEPGAKLWDALRASGRDVWIIELRGSRSSRRLPGSRAPVDVATKLAHDLPAAIQAIKQATGVEQVDVIGHSLGGFLACQYAGGPSARDIRRIVSVSSPVDFRAIVGPATRGLAALRGPLRRLGGFGIPKLASLRGPVAHAVVLAQHFRLSATTAALRRAWLTHAVEDLHGSELAQIIEWANSRPERARQSRKIQKIACPVLVIASRGDSIVPPAAARAAFDVMTTADKRWLEVGRRRGARFDYGHAGILVAPAAASDVHDVIVGFLAEQLPAETDVHAIPATARTGKG